MQILLFSTKLNQIEHNTNSKKVTSIHNKPLFYQTLISDLQSKKFTKFKKVSTFPVPAIATTPLHLFLDDDTLIPDCN